MKAGTLEPTGKPAGSSASCSLSQEVQHAPEHLSAVLTVYLHLRREGPGVKLVSFRNILKLLDCLLAEFYGASLWDAMFHLS